MSETFPPVNYIPTKSAVAGIEVYMPAPAESTPHQEVVDFKCPQCGATTAFSVEDGGLTCSHCGYHEAPQTEVVGTKADEFEFTVQTLEQSAAHGWGEERKEVECQNCGARTSTPPDTLTHTCPFCGSNKVIQRRAPQDVLRPRFLIPFKVQAARCQEVAREWIGSSWMTPAALKQVTRLAPFIPIYLPFWTFDARTKADWKAEVGHTRTESYHVNGEWRTRTVTDWRWESGRVDLIIDDLLVEGTKRLSALLLSRMKNYDMGELCSYEPKYLAGMQAQAYDIPLEQAWEEGRREMREQTREACVARASTSQVRNFSMHLDFSDESWRYILLPVYLATYNYENKLYQVMINGQTGAISGQRPVDWTRVWLAVAALLSPGLLLGLVGMLTVVLGGVGVVIGGLGFVLLIVGLVIGIVILVQAYNMDKA